MFSEVRFLLFRLDFCFQGEAVVMARVVGPFNDSAQLADWHCGALELFHNSLIRQHGLTGVSVALLDSASGLVSDPGIPPSMLAGNMLRQHQRHLRLLREPLGSGNLAFARIYPDETS